MNDAYLCLIIAFKKSFPCKPLIVAADLSRDCSGVLSSSVIKLNSHKIWAQAGLLKDLGIWLGIHCSHQWFWYLCSSNLLVETLINSTASTAFGLRARLEWLSVQSLGQKLCTHLWLSMTCFQMKLCISRCANAIYVYMHVCIELA